MKKSDITKLRDKSADELNGMVGELRDVMLKARIARSLEGKQAGMGYRVARRQIARIQTILTQKGASSSAAPAAKAEAPAKAVKAAKPAKAAKTAAAKTPAAKKA